MAQLWNSENQKWDTVETDHDGTKLLIPKAVLMSWEEELGMYTPWNTWFGAKDADAAWKDALSWAMAEDIPAIQNAA